MKKEKKTIAKGIRKKDKEAVKRAIGTFFEEMSWMFEYQNFDRVYAFLDIAPELEDPESSVAAEVKINNDYRQVSIKIFPAFFDLHPDRQRAALLHELAHTFAADIKKKAYNLLNGKLETPDGIDGAVEQLTSRVTELLHALLIGRLRYARKGYAAYLKSVTPSGK